MTRLRTDNANIAKYRPWFDHSCRALTIWSGLTSAMPVLGSVSVKSVEIRDLSTVSAHGTASSLPAFNVMREALGKVPGVSDLHADTAGQPPTIQYNLTYQWVPVAEEGATTNAN